MSVHPRVCVMYQADVQGLENGYWTRWLSAQSTTVSCYLIRLWSEQLWLHGRTLLVEALRLAEARNQDAPPQSGRVTSERVHGCLVPDLDFGH